MADYVLVQAGTDVTLATWDSFPPARDEWERVRDKQSVRLLCMWGCGCVRQAIRAPRRHRKPGSHTGWRRVIVCDGHGA